MSPPRLPRAAGALANITGGKAIEITSRQGTGVSTSDVTRGVYEALKAGLTVVDYELGRVVCDAAHNAENAWANGHREGFCRACAGIYVAVNKALEIYDTVED